MANVHGVTTKEGLVGPISVMEAPTAIVALVGTAPIGPLNQLIYVRNTTDAAQFGLQVPGFTIPSFLNHHFTEGGQPVLVVNVFDVATDITPVSAESMTLVAGKGKTANAPVSGIVVTDSGGSSTWVRDTDYKIDAYGNIQSLNYTNIPATATIKVSYNKLDAAGVTSSDVVGTISGTARTGMKCFDRSYNLYLVEPKFFAAPGFSHLSGVQAEMRSQAAKYKAEFIIDAPTGTSLATALTSRGPDGTIGFNFADERGILPFPEQYGYDPATNANIAKPYSAFITGLQGLVDDTLGFWNSFDNKVLRSSFGPVVPISSSAVNSGSDAQALNDAGIVTNLVEGASGVKIWGQRGAGYPSSTAITVFIACRRTIDIATRNMQYAGVQFIGRPMITATRDQILETFNEYVRSLIGRGAMADGSRVIYDPNKNSEVDISAGKWVFTAIWCPSPSLENLEIETIVDINLLASLNA